MKKITFEKTNRVCILVFGNPGIGKTSLLRTIPKGEKVCVLSAESGLLCVSDLVESGAIEGFEIKNHADFDEAHTFLATNKEAKDRYQWIFIDSLSEICEVCVEELKDEFPNPKDSFKMWGAYKDRILKLVRSFRDMSDYNVVFTCLDSADKDELNRRYVGPGIPGQSVKEKLPALFDEVLFLDVMDDEAGQKRYFLTQPGDTQRGMVIAKDRSGKLNKFEEPSISSIATKILGGNK